jgi:hypothetical protein
MLANCSFLVPVEWWCYSEAMCAPPHAARHMAYVQDRMSVSKKQSSFWRTNPRWGATEPPDRCLTVGRRFRAETPHFPLGSLVAADVTGRRGPDARERSVDEEPKWGTWSWRGHDHGGAWPRRLYRHRAVRDHRAAWATSNVGFWLRGRRTRRPLVGRRATRLARDYGPAVELRPVNVAFLRRYADVLMKTYELDPAKGARPAPLV